MNESLAQIGESMELLINALRRIDEICAETHDELTERLRIAEEKARGARPYEFDPFPLG